MGMNLILCALSAKRLALLEEDPEMLGELIAARDEVEIPGLLDLGKAWHAVDVILGEASDPVLGDAIVARTGGKLKAAGAFGKARVNAPARVAQIAKALGSLPSTLIVDRYPSLHGKQIHGNYGQERFDPDDTAYLREQVKKAHEAEIRELGQTLSEVVALYAAASEAKQSMMSVIV